MKKTIESNYTKEANNLLKKLGVKFTAKFITNDYHFADDKQTRDIFALTLRRGNKGFSVRFGQSINESTGNGSNVPTAYDMITCLTKYDPESFENFCREFGYDEDSRKAEKTYKAVVKEWDQVNKFFTSDELEMLQEIQ